jgi:pimeloyl-ACP methyl ester carboxylesterase
MPALDPSGDPVDLGEGVTIQTPGLEGEAERRTGAAGTRSPSNTNPAFEAALADQGVQTLHTIEIEGAVEQLGAPPSGVRSTRYGENAILLETPAVSAGAAQVVFMQDESGLITWNFAEGAPIGGTTRGGATTTFVLRRYVPAPQGEGDTRRGLIGAIGTKVIKILAFPIQAVAGRVGTHFANEWEGAHRPYGLRVVDPATYATDGAGRPLEAEDWRAFEGPVLLLVHGTFSRSSSTFGLIAPEVFGKLHSAYGGRVVAFDHPTMGVTPRENIEWLLGQIAPDADVVIHALTHSRGGLVARTLAEKLSELEAPHKLAVRTLVLVGAPDSGTALADAKHMNDFIDTYTNLINFFPSSTPLDIFECIVAAVKELAIGALDHLTGLQSMCPEGPFQEWLNTGEKGDARYYAVASSFSPVHAGLRDWAKQRLMTAIFTGNDNDLVVPTAGVYDRNGSQCFPIDDSARLLFVHGEGVNHCMYFGRPELHAKLFDWLG